MRRLSACLAAAAAVLALLTPGRAGAEPTGNDNTAIAVNTKDGSSLFKLSFKITRVMSDTVDAGNAAVAYASCTDCQTTAVAIQFVLLLTDTTTFTPENLALAINENCIECDTLASAYQFVIDAGGPVHLTPEGKKRLQEIRKELADLADSGLSSFELQARVDALANEAYEVMKTSLVPAGNSHDAGGDNGAGAGPNASTSSTATQRSTTSTTGPPTTTTSTTEAGTSTSTSTTATSAP